MQKMNIPTVSQRVFDEIDALIEDWKKEPSPVNSDMNELMYAAGGREALRHLRIRLEKVPHDAR